MIICVLLPGLYTRSAGQKCGWSVGGPANRYCPEYGTQTWNCLEKLKGCKDGNYHCAKDPSGYWKEVCDEQKDCHIGTVALKLRCGGGGGMGECNSEPPPFSWADFLAHLRGMLRVSYCDHPLSGLWKF